MPERSTRPQIDYLTHQLEEFSTPAEEIPDYLTEDEEVEDVLDFVSEESPLDGDDFDDEMSEEDSETELSDLERSAADLFCDAEAGIEIHLLDGEIRYFLPRRLNQSEERRKILETIGANFCRHFREYVLHIREEDSYKYLPRVTQQSLAPTGQNDTITSALFKNLTIKLPGSPVILLSSLLSGQGQEGPSTVAIEIELKRILEEYPKSSLNTVTEKLIERVRSWNPNFASWTTTRQNVSKIIRNRVVTN